MHLSRLVRKYVGVSTVRTFSQISANVDFNNITEAYKNKSTFDLIKAYVALSSCRTPLMRKYGADLLQNGGKIMEVGAKLTYFDFFCGGRTIDECDKIVQELDANHLKSYIHYAIEGPTIPPSEQHSMTPAQREKHEQALYRHHEMITKATLDAISFSNEQNKLIAAKKRRGKSNDGYIPVTNVNGLNGIDPKGEKYYDTKAMPFNVVKITAIASCALLERLSEVLSFIDVFPNSTQTHNLLSAPILVNSDEKVTRYIKERAPRTPAWNHKVDNPPKPLSTIEIEQLDRVIARLDSLCKKSEEVRITLLIDAEQTYYQPAIDLLYMMMCLRYNKKVPDAQLQVPTVYNTYQNYLKSTLARLKHDLDFAQSNGCLNGSKLVRGAYLKVEKERAESHGSEYPLNGSLHETHDRYHAAVDFVLSNIDKMGVLIASHNQATDEYATSRIVNDFKLHRSDPRINFGQLYGMGDFLSLTLANAGFNIVKYVPCGPVMEILPYLSRRLTENSDILGGSKKETDRMLWEMKRRIGLAK